MRVNFSNITLFFQWFNIIKFWFSRVSIYKDQCKANIEEVDKSNINIIAKNPNKDITGIEKANKSNISIIVEITNIGKSSIKEVDKLNINIVTKNLNKSYS